MTRSVMGGMPTQSVGTSRYIVACTIAPAYTLRQGSTVVVTHVKLSASDEAQVRTHDWRV